MITHKTFNQFWSQDDPNYKGLCDIIKIVRQQIDPTQFENDETPCIQLTISVNNDCSTWSYQSGDTSFMGSCYHDQYWGIGYVDLESTVNCIANDLISNLAEEVFSNPENELNA